VLSQVVAEMEAEEQDVQKDTAPQTTGTSSEPRSKTKKVIGQKKFIRL